jgi:hypothetical protein
MSDAMDHGLIKLVERGQELEEHYKTQWRSTRAKKPLKYSLSRLYESNKSVQEEAADVGNPDGKALADLLIECYPHLQKPRAGSLKEDAEFKKSKRRLQHRLSSAQNWHCLATMFPVGIVALVPPDFHTDR